MAKQVDITNIVGLLQDVFTKIKSAFWAKGDTSQLSIDNTPTSGSNNLVKSGGVYTELAKKYEKPSGGIPASDLASGVIPTVPTISTDIQADKASDAKTASPKAVFDSLGKWGVVSQTQTWTGSNETGWDYTMSNPVWGFIPLDFINTVGMFGAVFNESTGYFELNGLTDISYEEMRKIWFTANLGQGIKNSGASIQGSLARTNINTFTQIRTGSIYLSQICGYCSYLEVFNMQGTFAPITNLANQLSWWFVSCIRMKKILPIGLNANSTTAGLNNAFSKCFSLEDIYIKDVKITTSFSNSPRLKLESVVYLVQNAANTTAITITLHATAYARCQADTTEYTYNEQTYTGILAYASAKNITIASA